MHSIDTDPNICTYVFGSYSKLIKLVRLHICLFSRLLFENQISLYSGLPPFITQTKQGNLYNKHAPTKGPFIYYVITFLGFLDPAPPLRNHVFSTENNQKLAFSDPPSPPTSDYVIYEWSLKVRKSQKISFPCLQFL